MPGMMLIDPEGLFHGRRLSQCSDLSRFIFPYMFFSSNGYGRIELNDALIVSHAFATFKQTPDLGNAVVDFVCNNLLFLYVENETGKLWGQWDTPERCLPKYKTARDKRSPAPDSKEFERWRRSRIPQDIAPFLEIFPKFFQNFSKNFSPAVAVADAVAERSGLVVGPVEIVKKPAHERGNGNINPQKQNPAIEGEKQNQDQRTQIVERGQQRLLQLRKERGQREPKAVGDLLGL